MSPAFIVLIGLGANIAQDHFPVDVDVLPAGAKARLGSRRYEAYSSSLSPDGKLIAVIPQAPWRWGYNGIINVYDAETGKFQQTLRAPAWMIDSVRFVSNTRLIGVDNDQHRLYDFDTETGHRETVVQMPKRLSIFECLDYSRDGKVLVERGPDGFNLWQIKPLKKLHVIPYPDSRGLETWSELSPDGSVFLTARGGKDQFIGSVVPGLVQVWDLKTGKERWRIEFADGQSFGRVAISPDGSRLAARHNSGIHIYDTTSGKQVMVIPAESKPNNTIQFDFDGKRVLLFRPSSLTVFSATDGKKLKEYALPTDPDPNDLKIERVVFTSDGKARMRSGRYPWMGVWDLEAGRPLAACDGHGCEIQTLRFSSDGRQLVSIDATSTPFGGRALTWNLTKRTTVEPFPRALRIEAREDDEWPCGWWFPDGKLAIRWRDQHQWERRLVVFDPDTGKQRYQIEVPDGLWLEIAYPVASPEGKHFILAGNGILTGDLPIYETATGKVAYTVKWRTRMV